MPTLVKKRWDQDKLRVRPSSVQHRAPKHSYCLCFQLVTAFLAQQRCRPIVTQIVETLNQQPGHFLSIMPKI